MYNEKPMIYKKNKMARRQIRNNIISCFGPDQLVFDAKAFSLLLLLFYWMSAKRAYADDTSSTYVPDLDQDADVTDDSSSFGVRAVVGIDENAVPVLVEKLREKMMHGNREQLQCMSNKKIALTTAYSGLGTAEAICTSSHGALTDYFGGKGLILCYAATENDATAQWALSCHKPTSRPHHRFGTVLERLFVVDRRRLEKIVDKYLGQWQLISEAEKRSEITKEVLLKEKRSMGKALFDELCTQLQSLAFQETAYCEEHGKHCCISPKATAELADCFWIEIAGTTCTPWSVMGNQMGWLDRHTLPCLVFFFSLRFFEVDQIAHECVPNFDFKSIEQIMSDTSETVMKWPGLADGNLSVRRNYSAVSACFAPIDIGRPSTRRRRYSEFHSSKWPSLDYEFMGVFAEAKAVCPSVYVCDVTDKLDIGQQWELPDVKFHGVVEIGSAGRTVPPDYFNVTECGFRSRLETFQCLALQIGLYDKEKKKWNVPVAFADISQDGVERGRRITTVACPALLRSSVPWELTRHRPVFIHERWVMQGFAHPITGVSSSSAPFPFTPEFLEEVSVRDQMSLLGNAMHMSAIGTWFLYCMSILDASRTAE